MDKTAIQNLTLGTFDTSRPFDKPFTAEEAGHINKLLSTASSKNVVRLQHFSHEGLDGETFHYAGIRRKDGSIPKDARIKRVYVGGLIDLGFLYHPPQNIEFIKAVKQAGIEVDSFLLHLVE